MSERVPTHKCLISRSQSFDKFRLSHFEAIFIIILFAFFVGTTFVILTTISSTLFLSFFAATLLLVTLVDVIYILLIVRLKFRMKNCTRTTLVIRRVVWVFSSFLPMG